MRRLSLVVVTEVGSRLARIEPAAKFDWDADWNNGLLPVFRAREGDSFNSGVHRNKAHKRSLNAHSLPTLLRAGRA